MGETIIADGYHRLCTIYACDDRAKVSMKRWRRCSRGCRWPAHTILRGTTSTTSRYAMRSRAALLTLHVWVPSRMPRPNIRLASRTKRAPASGCIQCCATSWHAPSSSTRLPKGAGLGEDEACVLALRD